MIWLLALALGGIGVGVGVVAAGSKAKRQLAKLVKVRVLGVDQGGGLTFEFDDLVGVRDAGYRRAIELGFGDESQAAAVLEALARDVDSRIGKAATLRAIRVGSLGEHEWPGLIELAKDTAATEGGLPEGSWGALRAAVNADLRARGIV